MEAVKPVCTHDGGCPQAAEPKHSHLKGGVDVSSAILPSIRLFGESPLLVGEQQKWYQQILQKVQNLMPHDYIKSCTLYSVVQQYVPVDYCRFHLTPAASTPVGPYIIPRNMKGFFLSQSTLREKFVKKKFQVFDLVGPLIILVQVNLSCPVERV